MKKYIFVLVLSGIVLLSCQHQPDPQPTAPTVVVSAPVSGLYNNGDTLFLNADLSDEDELHEAL